MFSLLIALTVLGADDRIAGKFSDVELDPPFDKYLRASPALMGSGGPKIIKLRNGDKVLLVVASVAPEDRSPKALLEAEEVCRAKALRDLVAGTQGVQIASLQKSEDSEVVVRTEKGEQSKLVSKYLEITELKLRTVARVAGRGPLEVERRHAVFHRRRCRGRQGRKHGLSRPGRQVTYAARGKRWPMFVVPPLGGIRAEKPPKGGTTNGQTRPSRV